MYFSQEQLAAMQAQQEKNLLSISLDENMFKHIRVEGKFELTSGKTSNYFYDFERLPPSYMTTVSGLLYERLKDKCEFEYVVGPGYGGIIPGYCVAEFAGKDFVAFNPRTKSFRGNVTRVSGGRYLIVDDVISTYKTVDEAVNVVAERFPFSHCVGAACFVFRGEKIREDFPTYFLHKGEVEV